MKLLKLTLKNFKGIRSFEFAPDGQNVSVYGTNGSGKSTLMDAFTWLLFDKNSHWEAKFGIKTLDSNGETIPKLEHTVTAILDDEGKKVYLEKTLKERWVKARGTAETVYNGNTTIYMAGSPDAPVPVSSAQYKKIVAGILDEGLFKMLSDPLYFNEKLKTEDRRKALVEIVGETSDDDVVKAHPDLEEVPSILNDMGIDDCRRGLKLKQRKVGQERDGIPERIDELSRQLPKWTAEQVDNARQNVHTLTERLESIQTEIARKQAPNQTDRELEIEKAKGNVKDARKACDDVAYRRMQVFEMKKAEKAQALHDLETKHREAEMDLTMLLAEAKVTEDKVTEIGKSLEALRQSFVDEKKNPFGEAPIDKICPTCGQNLPGDMVKKLEAERAQREAMFNQTKAENLKKINEKGAALSADLKIVSSSLEGCHRDIGNKKTDIEEIKKKISTMKNELDSMTPPEPGELEHRLEARAAEAQKELERLTAAAPGKEPADVSPLREEAQSIQERIDRAKAVVADTERGNSLNRRIQELLKSDGQLAQQQADLERKLALLDEFSKTKMDMVNEKCNQAFAHVRWVMFRPNVTNSGYEACCEATWDGVPYKDLNTGCRINAGLDVINTLAKRAGKTAPIFLDNAESVVKLLPTDAQVIRLVVSDADKTLRVEKEE
ncbi:P-loop containing region of AAA domain-containing protein [Acidaminococcus fermentans]|uniref:ATP-binding protein n=1 Tax=Acidaminococcus fermentans TaxID=905 RepID=UPI0008E9D7B2|nr:ATP-binding protein [Acidaminococcus fermentans]SFO62713.1 P-loop containing region of AAA domain-containing protein [Acidaminococcus fermentans]